MKHLANNIVILRENLRLTQNQLAVKLGSKRGAVAQWELGSNFPREIKITKLAKLAGVTEDEFKNSPLPLKSDGHGTFRLNFKAQSPYKNAGGTITMNNLINLSMIDLLALQKLDHDDETQRAIQAVITFKIRYESLENENKLLREMIELLKQKKK